MKTFITTFIITSLLIAPGAALASQVQGTVTATVASNDPLVVGGTNTNGSDTITPPGPLTVGGTGVSGADTATTTATSTENVNNANNNNGGGGNGGGGGGSGSNKTTLLKGDANKDGKVDVLDFVLLMAQWNRSAIGLSADFNTDAKVDVLDFVLLMASWTK
ncbi:MAG: dockerin type I domain-containing protein [Patescibacteria group bacterium]